MYNFYMLCDYINLSHCALPILLPELPSHPHHFPLLIEVVIPPELMILQPTQKTEEQYNTITKLFKISLKAVL
jgi:hypothetical protein